MNLGDTVYRLIAGRTHYRREEESSADQVKRALKEAGGVSQLARSIGVARTTVQRWNKGSKPTLESQELIRSVLRRADLSQRREHRLRMADGLIVKGKQEGRNRTINLGRYLRPGTMDKAVEAYLRGATARDLHVVVWGGITDQSYRWLFQPPGGVAQMSIADRERAASAAFGAGGSTGGGGGSAARGGGGGGDDEEDEYDEEDEFEEYMDEYDFDDVADLDPKYAIH